LSGTLKDGYITLCVVVFQIVILVNRDSDLGIEIRHDLPILVDMSQLEVGDGAATSLIILGEASLIEARKYVHWGLLYDFCLKQSFWESRILLNLCLVAYPIWELREGHGIVDSV
jgi:hypothetical protein